MHYEAENGRANCPVRYVSPDGYHLGMWQSKVKTQYRKGILSRKRIALLNRIGFDWGKVYRSKCQGTHAVTSQG